MDLGLRFERVYRDGDVLEVEVSAWNGVFAGKTNVYIGTSRLEEVAGLLKGFPSSAADVREFTIGAFGPAFAGGAFFAQFYCNDASAHVIVELRIEASFNAQDKSQSVNLLLPTEASAIDAFVEELVIMNKGAQSAYLRGLSS